MSAGQSTEKSVRLSGDVLQRGLTLPIEAIDVADPEYFEHDAAPQVLDRLRREAPVHFCPTSENGSYWSITRYEDIRNIELDVPRFSSADGITVNQPPSGVQLSMFIAMDPPRHDEQRRAILPVLQPKNVRRMEDTIRTRAAAILDSLPVGESFDWVDRVSIELTTQMLATLFDFPFEERRRLTRWSDLITSGVLRDSPEDVRRKELEGCLAAFQSLWNEKAKSAPGHDLISMLAHAPATRDMNTRPFELLGNVILLIVGGNDTTRNSITGGVLALNRAPEQYDKLRRDPSLVTNMVSEIIRWQTPLAHMRRTATQDVQWGGQKIRAGEKVVLWYLAANRDEAVFENGGEFDIERPNARHHIAFGFGAHRCIGAHLAELQLRVVWEEILKRFEYVEVMEEPTRTRSSFVRGYTHMPVRVHPYK
ncbi:MAG TPA: cytochrome P450 [Myxococcota bacterium]|nr:cytochrome P450 [Myxococcota bacterium]